MASWFSEGTVTVTNGNATVTGAGTKFSNCRSGDMFVGPDNGIYQVINPSSDTTVSISPPYRGATAAAASYGIVPVNGYPKALADAVNLLVQQWGATLAGLGSVSVENIVPLSKGGTGSGTVLGARNNLGIKSAGLADIGNGAGNVPDARRLGFAETLTTNIDWFNDGDQGVSTNLFGPGSPNLPSGGTGYYYKQTMRYGTGGNRLHIAWPYGTGTTGTIKFQSVFNGTPTPLQEIYHTGNTTRGSGGVLSAASPIMRIASVGASERLDLQEQTFVPAGDWGVVNSEALGVTVERLDVGEYKITGSLGLALEGWRTQDPCSPDGGRTLGVTESEQSEDGAVIIRLYKQRWTLSDDGEIFPGRGAPMDVPTNSWIDVRLEMPNIDAPLVELAAVK